MLQDKVQIIVKGEEQTDKIRAWNEKERIYLIFLLFLCIFHNKDIFFFKNIFLINRNNAMKKIVIVVFISFLGVSLFAQSTNDAQRILSTWKSQNGTAFVFNDNGTYIFTDGSNGGNVCSNYFLSNSRLIFQYGSTARVTDYYFSADGRILVFTFGTTTYWLVRQ